MKRFFFAFFDIFFSIDIFLLINQVFRCFLRFFFQFQFFFIRQFLFFAKRRFFFRDKINSLCYINFVVWFFLFIKIDTHIHNFIFIQFFIESFFAISQQNISICQKLDDWNDNAQKSIEKYNRFEHENMKINIYFSSFFIFS